MTNVESGEVHVAIMSTPKNPVSENGGTEVFTGVLANELARQGLPVRIYGQEGPAFDFNEGVTYVETGPSTDTISARDSVSIRRAVNETSIAPPLRLAMDIVEDPDKRWVVIDNDTTSAALAPFLANRAPHIMVQHMPMTENAHAIYRRLQACGTKVVAIADHQREDVTERFGPLHDITIKNGIDVESFASVQPRQRQRGEPIHIGTLSRIEATDVKGIGFAITAFRRLRQEHAALLTIAGPISESGIYDTLIAPNLGDDISYAGTKCGDDKALYLADLHVGAALSNPGGWDDTTGSFTNCFREGNSLSLQEMIYCGSVPVSTDSGGAEAMKDTGLEDFVVPLEIITTEGVDPFIDCVAKTMLEAATRPIELPALRSRVRTSQDMGEQYADYIMRLVESQACAG